jgi:hypothetical protein
MVTDQPDQAFPHLLGHSCELDQYSVGLFQQNLEQNRAREASNQHRGYGPHHQDINSHRTLIIHQQTHQSPNPTVALSFGVMFAVVRLMAIVAHRLEVAQLGILKVLPIPPMMDPKLGSRTADGASVPIPRNCQCPQSFPMSAFQIPQVG